MRYRVLITGAVVAVVVLFAQVAPRPTRGLAAPPHRAQLAVANFQGFDTSGCVRTWFGAIARHDEDRPTMSQSGMLVTYNVDNICTGQPIDSFQAIVPLGADDFSVPANRRSAHLDADASIPRSGSGVRHVVIQLSWTSNAKAQNEPTLPAGMERSRVAAVDGLVTVDGATVVPGLQSTTPGPFILWTQP